MMNDKELDIINTVENDSSFLIVPTDRKELRVYSGIRFVENQYLNSLVLIHSDSVRIISMPSNQDIRNYVHNYGRVITQ